MTLRYNPQSIEKQVRKWPVLFSEKDIHSDLSLRLNQMLGTSTNGFVDPFSISLPFEEDISSEYGIDACRLSLINSDNVEDASSLLESSYKWISKVYESLKKTNNKGTTFDPMPWLEALIQFQDHILTRKADRLALALVMKAFKIASPDLNLSLREKDLVFSCLYPFIPVFVASFCNECFPEKKINEIIESFKEYKCVKIALEKGGWHWQVFSCDAFEQNPISELSKVKWVKKAIKNKIVTLKEDNGGVRICFS